MDCNTEIIWERIKRHQGEKFYTVTKRVEFDYSVKGSSVKLHNTNQDLSKKYFERTLQLKTVKKPSDIRIANERGEIKEPRGTSYIYGILSDPRIGGLK